MAHPPSGLHAPSGVAGSAADLGATATLVALLATLGAVLFLFNYNSPEYGSGQMWIVASPYKELAGITLTVLSALVFAVWWVERGLRVRWPAAFWPLLAVFALSVVSTAVSPFRWISVERLGTLTALGALVFVIVETLRRPRHFAIFVGGMLVIAAVVTLFGLYQALNQALWDAQEPVAPRRPAMVAAPAGTAAERENRFWDLIQQAAASQRAEDLTSARRAVDRALTLKPRDPAALRYRSALARKRFQLILIPGTEPFARAARIYSFMVNPNFLGGVLVTFLPMTLAGALASRRVWAILALGLLGVGMFAAIALTWTRGALLGAIVGLLVFYVLGFRRLKARFRYVTQVSLAGWALLALAVTAGAIFVASRRPDFFRGGTIETRRLMWQGALKAIADRPLFGHGIGTFQLIFPTYRPTDYRKERLVSFNTSHAHCEALELLTDFGVVGLAACLLAAGVFFREVWRHLSPPGAHAPPGNVAHPPPGVVDSPPRAGAPHARARPPELVEWLGLGAAAGCAGMLADNLVGVDLRWAAGTWAFWTMAAVAMAAVVTARGEPGRLLVPTGERRWVARLLVYPAGLLLLGYTAHDARQRSTARTLEQDADLHIQQAGEYMAGDEAAAATQVIVLALTKLEASRERDPHLLETFYRLGHVYHTLGRLLETTVGRDAAQKMGIHLSADQAQDLAISYFNWLRTLAPNYARVHKQEGLVYVWMQRYHEAIAALKRDLIFNPDYDNEETLLGLGDAYLGIGRTDLALECYRGLTAHLEEERDFEAQLKALAAKEADLRKHGGGLSGDERRNVDTLKRRLGLLRESQTLVRVAAAREVAIDRLSRSEASCPVRLMAALLLAAR